jgi:hypothetical protein
MMHRSARFAQLEAEHARSRLRDLSFNEALAILEALWREAVQLNPDFPSDWRDDLGPTLEVARAVNGLPPSP